VFQGEQAAGKSRWLKRLAELWPEGWGEGHVSPDDKDHELRHLDNFIWHVAEFDSTTSRREVGALKDYFTKDTVNVRRPYSRLPIIGRSICSFCASVNSHEFLHDVTGNRRYLVIPITALNADHTVSIPQVMAEAKAAMEAGEQQWFSKDEITEVNKLNSHFLSREDYLEDIEALVKPGGTKATVGSLMEMLGYSELQLTRPIRSNIRTVLERKKIPRKTIDGRTYYLIDTSGFRPLGDIISFKKLE
jgi:putative DNA primase/helicase